MAARRMLVVVGLLMGMLGAWLVPAEAAPPAVFTTLDPGRPANLTETVPLQVVMLGYNEDSIDAGYLSSYLPDGARPVDRNRRLYDPGNAEMGLQYSFAKKVVYTDSSYEDSFFTYLLSIGINDVDLYGTDVSFFQALYNAQSTRKLDITHNLVLDPAKVEKWLLDHPAPGIDSTKDTVVFVNWWGRSDFRFHDYQAIGEKQSEAGLNLSDRYWSRRLIAWGGTGAHDEESSFGRPSRTWFHDLSAGPDWRTGGWVLDNNFGGYGPDPATQAIIPPVWEYALGGAQDRLPLPDALGVIARFVATNMLFAPSPTYGHDTDANISDDVELDMTVYGNVATTPTLLREELGDLLGTDPKIEVDHRPNAGTPKQCHEAFLDIRRCRPETDPSIYPVSADYFVGAEREIPKWRDGSAGLEAPSFLFESDRGRAFVGLADDNWTDGTRTATFSVIDPTNFAFGIGTTSNLIHEYGHFFGLSHPHDGFEGEWGPFDYGPNGAFFLWVGDEVSSVMSYLGIENDFSQFDVDNYQRWQCARYLRAANMIAAQVLAAPKASAGLARLMQADGSFTAAQTALAAHDYSTAATRAREGYQQTRAAATATAVTVPKIDAWVMAKPGSWHGRGEHSSTDGVTEPVDAFTTGVVPAPILPGFGSPTRS